MEIQKNYTNNNYGCAEYFVKEICGAVGVNNKYP